MKRYKVLKFLTNIRIAWKKLKSDEKFKEDHTDKYIKGVIEELMTYNPELRFKLLLRINHNLNVKSVREIEGLEKDLVNYRKALTNQFKL